MTILGRLAAYFPLLHLAGIAWSAIRLIQRPDIITVIMFLSIVYLIPPLLFRLYCLRYPVSFGRWILNAPQRCDWWIAHQFQMTYAAVPIFESVMRLVPGFYSAWLRLWGSRIGKRIYWTPLVEIVDRHMLRVGDDVVFGHRVICTSHIITRKASGDVILILRPPNIGAGTLIGARARIGPGVRIPERAVVPYNAEYKFFYVEEPRATDMRIVEGVDANAVVI